MLDLAWACLLQDARDWDRARLSGVLAAAPHMEKGKLSEVLADTREDELRQLMNPPAPDEAEAYERLEQYLKG